MNNKVVFVSYPRSGHHALIRILSEVTNLKEGLYCEGYNCKDEWQKKIDCSEKRGSSDGLTCTAGRPIIKSHDFELNLPVEKDIKYVVQYRDPMLSIVSYYNLQKRKSKNFDLTQAEFWSEKYKYWEGFYKKWVLNKNDNIMIVKYDDICEFSKIIEVSQFLGLQVLQDEVKENIFLPKRTEYDENFFKGLDVEGIKSKILMLENL